MRTVTIADLRNNLSRYLREVRQGRDFTVLSRDVPVARLSPVGSGRPSLESRPPLRGTPCPGEVPLPPPLGVAGDVVAVLLEERGTR